MSFFAVEVDYYRGSDRDTSVLVPRTAFVPSWVKEPSPRSQGGTVPSQAARLATAPEGTAELMKMMDALADELRLDTADVRTGRHYRPSRSQYGVGVYATGRGAEFNLEAFRTSGQDEWADSFLSTLSEVTGRRVTARAWPAVPAQSLVSNWQAARQRLLLPLFEALAANGAARHA